MTKKRIPLVQPLTSRQPNVDKDSCMVNGLKETTKDGRNLFVKRPGLRYLPTGSGEPGRGSFGIDTGIFFVIGDLLKFYNIDLLNAETIGYISGGDKVYFTRANIKGAQAGIETNHLELFSTPSSTIPAGTYSTAEELATAIPEVSNCIIAAVYNQIIFASTTPGPGSSIVIHGSAASLFGTGTTVDGSGGEHYTYTSDTISGPITITTGSNDTLEVTVDGGTLQTFTIEAGTYPNVNSLAAAIPTITDATVTSDSTSVIIATTSAMTSSNLVLGGTFFTSVLGTGTTSAGFDGTNGYFQSSSLVLPITIVEGENDLLNVIVDGASNYTIDVPTGTTSVTVETIGGGGGGSGGGGDNNDGGMGGFAGSYTKTTFDVTEGTQISCVIGIGGAGGIGTHASSGSMNEAAYGKAGSATYVLYNGTKYAEAAGGAQQVSNASGDGNVIGSAEDSEYTNLEGTATGGTANPSGNGGDGTVGGGGGGGGSPHTGMSSNTYGNGGRGGDGWIKFTWETTSDPHDYIFLHTKTQAWTIDVIDGATPVLTEVTMPFSDTEMVDGIAHIDGYINILTKTGRMYSSAINDPTKWDALDYISAENEPDMGVAICKHLNYAVVFKEWTTEFFYDAGNATGSPFSVNQTGTLELGCIDGKSVVSIQQTVTWVGQSLAKGAAVYMLDGLTPVKISDAVIERYLDAEILKSKDNMYGTAFQIPGHFLYILYLGNLDTTLVYDYNEKHWTLFTTTLPINRVGGD